VLLEELIFHQCYKSITGFTWQHKSARQKDSLEVHF